MARLDYQILDGLAQHLLERHSVRTKMVGESLHVIRKLPTVRSAAAKVVISGIHLFVFGPVKIASLSNMVYTIRGRYDLAAPDTMAHAINKVLSLWNS
jgi:hypothetical protein